MDSQIDNITPQHFPSSLLPEIEEKIKDAKAIFVVMLMPDNKIVSQMCGHMQKDILWIIEKAKLTLLGVE